MFLPVFRQGFADFKEWHCSLLSKAERNGRVCQVPDQLYIRFQRREKKARFGDFISCVDIGCIAK
jgi:hypothetical protein